MKKKLTQSFFGGVIFLAGLLVKLSSCQFVASTKTTEFGADSMVAHFDYFTYKGNDDFYKENPLPGSDYFYNPILPGWYSDPSICTNGTDYFMVTSTFSYFPGVPLFHSTDMMNWKQVGHVLNRPEQLPLDGQRVSEGIFAPAISYNPDNQTYYMITTNIQKGNFLVKTTDPFGPWSDPIWLPDVHGIDPSLFFDEDGKAYIVNNDEPDGGSTYDGHRAIRIIEYDVATDKTVGSGKVIVNGGVNLADKPIWIEGPHLYKINGHYLLMCAEGGTSVDHSEVVFKSNSPRGPFIPWEKNPILTQRHLDPYRPVPVTCAGHADLIRKSDGSWWSVFLACRPINNWFENLGRETFLLPVSWSDDGFPYMTQGEELVPRIVQMQGVERDSSASFGNFVITDDFSATQPEFEWLTLRGSATEFYSLTENQGFLTLKCAPVASNELKTPAYIGRRLQHHQFETTTRMYFSPRSEQEMDGVLLLKDESHQYLMALQQKNQRNYIRLIRVEAHNIEELASKQVELDGQAIDLKVGSTGTHFSFYYAAKPNDWELLADSIDAYYLSTAHSEGFTGTTIGLYASEKPYFEE